jgi:hypothetical protein
MCDYLGELAQIHERLSRLESEALTVWTGPGSECPATPLKQWTVVYHPRMTPAEVAAADRLGARSGMRMCMRRRGYMYILELGGCFVSEEFKSLAAFDFDADTLAVRVCASVAGALFALELPDGTTIAFTRAI